MFNKAVFGALKPGGVYVVVDHVAADGAGLTATATLHRIDPASVRAEVEAAGFVYEGERYASMSTVATRITGTKWNGPVFFGVKPRKAPGRAVAT